MSETYNSLNKNFYIDNLDGLRGLAALIVVFSHTSNAGLFLVPDLNMSGTGKSGVYLFFILSSFLLTRPILSLKDNFFTSQNLTRYFKRRVTRIFPLYLFFLFVALLITKLSIEITHSRIFYAPFSLSWNELGQHIFLQEGKGVAWSIPVEFKYYFLLPIIGWCICKPLNNNIYKSATFLFVGFAIIYFVRPADVKLLNTTSYIETFFLGALAAVIKENLDDKKITLGNSGKYLLYLGLIGIIITIPSVYSLFLQSPAKSNIFHDHILMLSCFWFLILLSLLSCKTWLSKALASKPARFLGKISFSLYLVHSSVINIIRPTIGQTNTVLACWLIFIISILLSWIAYRLIERPSSRL